MLVVLISKGANKSFLIGLLALLLVSGCTKEKLIDPLKNLENKSALVLEKSLKVPLDDLTDVNPYYYQVYLSDSVEYFLFVNYNEYSIVFMDIEKEAIVKSLQLEREGPDGIGDLVSFYYHNPDSLFVMDRFKKMKLIDTNGHVVNEYRVGLNVDLMEYDGDLATDFSQKVHLRNNSFYYTNANYRSSYRHPVSETLDLLRDTVSVWGEFPKYYSREAFESKESSSVATEFNTSTNHLVYGFHIESDLFVRDEMDNMTRVPTGIPALCIQCHKSPFRIRPNTRLAPEQYMELDERYFKNYTYLNLIYEPVTNVIVRVLKAPTSDLTYESKPPPMKYYESEYHLVVLDGDTYQYMGHTTLSGALYDLRPSGGVIFAANGAVYVKKLPQSVEDENYMEFDKFKLEK